MTLNVPQVKQRVYEDLQRLQLHLERANKASGGREQPLHLLAAHRQRLQEDSARARGALLKLGRFAALVDRMTLQSLVTAAQRGAAAFLSHVVQVTVAPPPGSATSPPQASG